QRELRQGAVVNGTIASGGVATAHVARAAVRARTAGVGISGRATVDRRAAGNPALDAADGFVALAGSGAAGDGRVEIALGVGARRELVRNTEAFLTWGKVQHAALPPRRARRCTRVVECAVSERGTTDAVWAIRRVVALHDCDAEGGGGRARHGEGLARLAHWVDAALVHPDVAWGRTAQDRARIA